MDWQEYFASAREMVQTIQKRLAQEKEAIRYVNLRYRCYGQAESKWLYDVTMTLEGENVILSTGDGRQESLPLLKVEYIRLRPFYYAACVGFKELYFYAYPEDAAKKETEKL